MKILLIANYQPDRQESMQRVAQLLESELKLAGHEVRVIRPEPWVGRIKPGATGLGKWLGYIDKFLIFPRPLRQAIVWADVVHICDHSNAFYTRYLQAIPHVVTCHDLLGIRSALGEIPQNPTRWSGKKLQEIILAGLNQAQRVVCVSQKTRQDLLRLSRLSPEAVCCVYSGLNFAYEPMERSTARKRLAALGIPPEADYLLHVGGEHWYKNREGVVKIFHALRSHLTQRSHWDNHRDLYLVMAGAPLPQEIREWIQKQDQNQDQDQEGSANPLSPPLTSRVIEASNVSNEDLQALYSVATALLFPSLQEGYGWPILEAHACGCPVFTTNAPPMTEVGGSAAFYINPNDIDGCATTIATQLPSLGESIVMNRLNAERFSNQAMIEGYLREYAYAIRERGTQI
ncbi:MAG: glycosyltransferase family 4 protein [Prochlorotrichaceae cyanobacterium]